MKSYLNTSEARFEISTVCNFCCIFCPHQDNLLRPKTIMPLNIFNGLLSKLKEQAPHITDITLSGMGEPFLDTTIIDKINSIKKNDYKIHILTNGSNLNKKKVELLSEIGVDDIRVSMHSLDKETYKRITGSSDKIFEKVLRNIEYIISSKCKLIITSDIFDVKSNDVKELIDKFSEKADLLEIWFPHNWVDTFNYRHGKSNIKSCGRPMRGPIQIQVDGTINMCCFDYNGELLLGDFTTQSLEEIFSSKNYDTLLDNHTNGTIDKSTLICKNCDQRTYNKDVVIYNSKYNKENRIGKTSTTYEDVI